MRSAAGGAISGCIVWAIVFSFLIACILPVSMLVGSITSTVTSDFVARTLEPYLCPEGSSAEIITYQTTTPDEFGNRSPSTAFEMQCVDAGGNIVREPGPEYGFIWIGLLAGVGVVITALLSFLLAAPAGILIGRLLGGNKKT